MKYHAHCLIWLCIAALSGCAGNGRPGALLPLAGAAAGGAIGALVTDEDDRELGMALGGIGGYAAGKFTQGTQRRQHDKGYNEGYEKGRSDAVKTFYWAKMDAQRDDEEEPPVEYRYYEVPVPAHITSDGVLVDPHYRVIEVVE